MQTLRQYRRELALGALAIWLATLGFELGAMVHTRWALHGVETALASERTAIADILSARGAAERARVAIGRLQALQAVPSQIALLQAVSMRIPGAGWRLLEWHMTDPQHLEMTLSMPKADPPGLVRALEGSDFLRAVRAEIGPSAPDQLVVRATVQEPAAGAASEVAARSATGSSEPFVAPPAMTRVRVASPIAAPPRARSGHGAPLGGGQRLPGGFSPGAPPLPTGMMPPTPPPATGGGTPEARR